MATTKTRITKTVAAKCRCAAGHTGNQKLTLVSGNEHAECNGCGTFYTADQMLSAVNGETEKVNGQGGVMLAR